MITLDDLLAARDRVTPVIRRTPVDRSDSLSRLAGRPVLLKPEHRQRTGSFKIRGAYNHVAQLPPGVPVVAASAGNHAQGVALAASLTGRTATIFMPRGAALPKVAATRAYGAEVRLEGEVVDDCIALARAFAAETGRGLRAALRRRGRSSPARAPSAWSWPRRRPRPRWSWCRSAAAAWWRGWRPP